MADEIKVLRSEAEYKALDFVYKAYAKLESNPGEYGITEGDLFNDDIVAKAMVENAEKLGLKGLKPEHVEMAMKTAKEFALDAGSGSEAIAKVAHDTGVNGDYRASQKKFYDLLAKEGHTILDSKQDYANVMRVVAAFEEIMSDKEELEDLGLTKDSSFEDWKLAIRRHAVLEMDDDDFDRVFVNAGKVVSTGATGINAIAELAKDKKPLVDSYKKFDGRTNSELSVLAGEDKASENKWKESRNINRKAKRTIFGTTFGKILMALAVPGALVGLFFGAAAVAGGIAALSSVASLGVVLSTGLIGFIGYNILKRPFQRLWDRLTKSHDEALALVTSAENVLGSSKNRKREKANYRSRRMAYEMADVRAHGISESDEKWLEKLTGKEEVYDIAELESGLDEEHFKPLEKEHDEEKGVEDIVTLTPEEPKVPVVEGKEEEKEVEETVTETEPKVEELKTEPKDEEPVVEEHEDEPEATKSHVEPSVEEKVKAIEKAIDDRVRFYCEIYEDANPGKTISDEEKAKMKKQAIIALDNYLDKTAVAVDVEVIDEHGEKSSATITIFADYFAYDAYYNGAEYEDDFAYDYDGVELAKDLCKEYEDNNPGKTISDAGKAKLTEKSIAMFDEYPDLNRKPKLDIDVVDEHGNVSSDSVGIDLLDMHWTTDWAISKVYGVEWTADETNAMEQEAVKAVKILRERVEGKELEDAHVEAPKEAEVKEHEAESEVEEVVTEPEVEAPVAEEDVVEADEPGKKSAPKREAEAEESVSEHEEAPVIEAVPVVSVDNIEADKEHFAELEKFQKECDKVGFRAPKGIVAQFVERIDTDMPLQEKLGEERLEHLREIVKKKPDVAKDVSGYIKTISKKDATIEGSYEDERFVLGTCHEVYMPHKADAVRAREEERRAEEERKEAERAEKERKKLERKAARGLKKASFDTTTPEVVEETPHEELAETEEAPREMGEE